MTPDAPPRPSRRSRWHPVHALAAGVLLLIVGVAALVWWQTERAYQEARAQTLALAEVRGMQLAQAKGGQIAALVASIDLALRQIRREWDGDVDPLDARARSLLALIPSGAVSHFTVADADGWVVYSSLEGTTRVNLSDRDYFRTRQQGDDRLLIGKPLQSRLSGQWSTLITRPILREGQFAGVVIASVPNAHLARLLSELSLSDQNDLIALMLPDGTFLARTLANDEAMGREVPRDRPFLSPDTGQRGVFYVPGLIDQVDRLYAWHRVQPYGLVLAVGTDEGRLLTPVVEAYLRNRQTALTLVLMVALAGGVIIVLLFQTARRQAALESSEAFRRRVFDSSPVPIVIVNPRDGLFLDCNPAAVRAYGLNSREDVVGHSPVEVSAPVQYDGTPSLDAAREQLQRVLVAGSTVFDWCHQRPNGTRWDAEVHLQMFESAGRRLCQFTLRDITDRRAAEQALRDSEGRFRSLAANVPGAIFRYVLYPDGHDEIDYMSPGCVTLWELDADAILHDPTQLWQMIVPEELPGMQASIQASARDLQPWSYIWRIVPRSGRTKWLQGSGQPEQLPDGRILWNSLILDITDRKLAEERIQDLVDHDELTHLLNRRGFLAQLSRVHAQAERRGGLYALLFIDLDHFKHLNDSLGHDAGDAALVEIAQRLVTHTRRSDVVARLGGDEFVVIVTADDEAEAVEASGRLAVKLLDALRLPLDLNGRPFTLSCSLGIALGDPRRATSADVLRGADLAMYSVKEAGRNSYRFFDEQIQHRMLARIGLEQDLRVTLAMQPQTALSLHLQPIVDEQTAVLGYEALLRWNRPGTGPVSPADFIPVAEQSGLIVPLGEWVLREACRLLHDWAQKPGLSGCFLAVNVSALQLQQPEFVAVLSALLRDTGAPAHRLKLELTESLLHKDIDETIAKLHELRELGVRLSLDDFGTGYSSLSLLRRLPIQELKIDRSFVLHALDQADDAAVARMIVQLAQTLGMDVVAEGVETTEQLDFLLGIGCRQFQGYKFGRPEPVEVALARGWYA